MKTGILFLIFSFTISSYAQVQVIEQVLETSQKLCAYQGEICVQVGPGKIGIRRSPVFADDLAFGTLTANTNLGGVKIPAGTFISFYNPQENSDVGWDFIIQSSQSLTYGSIHFKENSKIRFDRFLQVYNPTTKKFIYPPHEWGVVRVRKLTAQNTNIEGVHLAKDRELGFETGVSSLAEATTAQLTLQIGTVAANGFYPAAKPIPLVAGDYVSIRHYWFSINASGPSRIVHPEGFLASEVFYNPRTGVLLSAFTEYENLSPIQGLRVVGHVNFFENGMLSDFENAAGNPLQGYALQTLNGISFSQEQSYYGFGRLWENGNALTISTNLIKENLNFIPAELHAKLPDRFRDYSSDRIRYFFNSQGEIKAMVTEYTDNDHHFNSRAYLISGPPNARVFTQVDQEHAVGKMLFKGGRYVEADLVEYLKNLP